MNFSFLLDRVNFSSTKLNTSNQNKRISFTYLFFSSNNFFLQDNSIYAIQFWTDSQDCNNKIIKTAAEAGFKMIFSNFDGTYLDCGYAGWVTDGNNWCSPYRGWQVTKMHKEPLFMYTCLSFSFQGFLWKWSISNSETAPSPKSECCKTKRSWRRIRSMGWTI